ncbi:protein of unknown function [Hyphomicrobium sp. MC1]|nr:protein of unknown function [Hyphomicrobium sp. MC1]
MFVAEKTQLNGVLLLTNNVDFHILSRIPGKRRDLHCDHLRGRVSQRGGKPAIVRLSA